MIEYIQSLRCEIEKIKSKKIYVRIKIKKLDYLNIIIMEACKKEIKP